MKGHRAKALGIALAAVIAMLPMPAFATMTAAGCKAKIKAAYLARTGQTISEGTFNLLLDLCQGIIDEITANAELTAAQAAAGIPVTTSGSATNQAGATTAPGPVTGKVR